MALPLFSATSSWCRSIASREPSTVVVLLAASVRRAIVMASLSLPSQPDPVYELNTHEATQPGHKNAPDRQLRICCRLAARCSSYQTIEHTLQCRTDPSVSNRPFNRTTRCDHYTMRGAPTAVPSGRGPPLPRRHPGIRAAASRSPINPRRARRAPRLRARAHAHRTARATAPIGRAVPARPPAAAGRPAGATAAD
jgi:hypothetical protein